MQSLHGFCDTLKATILRFAFALISFQIVAIFLFVLLIPPPRVVAQCPDPQGRAGIVTGTVKTGDGSTPFPDYFQLGGQREEDKGAANFGSFRWGAPITICLYGTSTWKFRASSGYYFLSPLTGGASCTQDLKTGKTTCKGSFSITLYANRGSFAGTVTMLPEGTTKAGLVVAAYDVKSGYVGGGGASTDDNGYFNFSLRTEPHYSNNWGVSVYDDGSGRGMATYLLTADFLENGVQATTYSSRLVTVDLVQKAAYMNNENDPSLRDSCPRNRPAAGPSAVGEPVNVLNGNVYFDQTDIILPGWGAGLNFVRSYNSSTAYAGKSGAFGQGWNHSYEKQLNVMATGVLMLRQEDGVAAYFQDMDGDLTFKASVPFTADNWIVKSANTYTLHFREGGYETYDSAGRLTSLVDPSGNTVTLERDAQGKLISITDPASRKLTLSYNAASLITNLTGPAGIIATYTYDANRRLQSVTYADSSGYSFTSDAKGQILSVTDYSGRILEAHAYSNGKAITSERSNGREKFTIKYGNLQTTVTDTLGNVTVYDWTNIWGMRYVTKITGPCASCGAGQSETQEWAYDDKGRTLSYKDGNGNITTHIYNADGDLISETNALNQTTTYTYDAQGRILTQTDPLGGVTSWTHGPAGPLTMTNPLNRVNRITYHAKGKPISTTDPRGMTTTFAYDAIGNLISTTDPLGNITAFGYDELSRRITTTDALNNTTATKYDGRGRIVRVTNPDGTHTDFTYDRGGRQTKVTDPLGHATSYTYDLYGRLETITDPLNGVTKYGYDLMSNLTSLTDARGKVTTFEYDGYGRMKKTTYPGDRSETFTYDKAGNLLNKTDRKGVVTTFAYNAINQLTGKTFSDDTPPFSFGYDNGGRLISAANTGDTLSWTYDLAEQLSTETSKKNASTVSYAYDLSGNRVGMSFNGTPYLAYTYDAADRLININRGTSNFTFGYDKLSRRALLKFPNGVVTTYAYDPLSRLMSMKTEGRRRVLWFNFKYTIEEINYTYDAASNRLSKNTTAGKETYTYDSLYRLTEVKRGNIKTEAYTYDAVGNRLNSLTQSNWTYSDRNELLSHSGASFTYDANGNLAKKTENGIVWVYELNAENQLKRVSRDGVEVARFSYDPMGRRVEKIVGGVVRAYTYDNEDILREQTGVSTSNYVHGEEIDEPLAIEDKAGNKSFYHADGLNSIIKTTNLSSKVTSSYRYDSFGNIESGATQGGYAYTGREWDAEDGLYYYRARYYDPKDRRFISEDSIGFEGGVNFYTYADNNPTTLTDPYGLTATQTPPGKPYIPPPPQDWWSRFRYGKRREFNPCLEGAKPVSYDDSGPNPHTNYAAWKKWKENFRTACEAVGKGYEAICPAQGINMLSGKGQISVCWCCYRCN